MTLLLCFAAALNVVVLSFIHEKVPASEPLPDFIFSITNYYPKALIVCEAIMLITFSLTIGIIIFHRYSSR